MMIAGDNEALPLGWHVDADNWGTRPATAAERAAAQNLAKIVGGSHAARACICAGMLCVMDAATARAFDRA